eukprot:4476610-Prymnesium_polylepis.1
MIRASRMALTLRSGAPHSVLDSRHAPCGCGRLQRPHGSVQLRRSRGLSASPLPSSASTPLPFTTRTCSPGIPGHTRSHARRRSDHRG